MNQRSARPLIIGLGSILALSTFALLAWDRTTHPTVSSPTPHELRLARAVWSATLISYFVAVPIILVIVRRWRAIAAWPWPEMLVLAAGLLVFTPFFDFLPRWPALFNSDLERLFACYLCATLAYVSGVAKMVSTWSAGSWSKFAAASGVVACCGAVVLAASWAVVYFE